MENELKTVAGAVSKFDFTARLAGTKIEIVKKSAVVGTVEIVDGKPVIERKYQGQKALMGALVSNAIREAF